MHQSDKSQSFLPYIKDHSPPRSRQTSASSIWAPKPQPLEMTWPKAIDSFSRDAEREPQQPARPRNSSASHAPLGGSEDVFGPVGLVGIPRKKDIGAIGDGRKKSSPEFDDSYAEQILRALNLNSPAPYPQHFPLSLNVEAANGSPGSPDLSPSSTTSTLLTPTDLSPAKIFDLKLNPPHEYTPHPNIAQPSLLFDPVSPYRNHELLSSAQNLSQRLHNSQSTNQLVPNVFPFFEPFSEHPSPIPPSQSLYDSAFSGICRRPDSSRVPSMSWRQQQFGAPTDWHRPDEKPAAEYASGMAVNEDHMRSSSQFAYQSRGQGQPQGSTHGHEASIFLQQKLKVADLDERHKIVDAICARGFEMMSHRGRVVDLATNCYGCHVLQKALDCEEDIRLLIVSELLLGDPALTLINKHASHVWSKIMELSWTAPAPPIFAYVNKSLKGKWASLACHETGSLVVQHAFENLEESAKGGIIDELLDQGPAVFGEITKNQWGSYCIQHILEHGSPKHRQITLDHLLSGLLEYATNEQGYKSVTKALKEGGKEALDKIVKRMCESAKGGRRAMIVDLALSVTGSQLIASTLPNADKDQRTLLYECIRGHIVTLRGCKTGSKVIWLFDRMRAYYGY
ncbi:hypothetical protein SERLADRAFT_412664 [Serpula lacrymans var. lacrymans S7.9]|uniref:PUM-HD domain-containing protein n=1 Tax=Serpula lacrymans var. lacrymans (strain S7.9) TaxID=578457 RepID=F8NFR7_SERL9|nr:uncharacterized protein SERLADRAFT_412664 [Serpula lacrymans var. lacrymans S7.9]EGO31275.1 hypothetical protein SERLADRAFT_412664 [Serpula lacrymans var. lacrymans S7.9]